MFKRLYKHGLLFCLLFITQLIMASVSKAQGPEQNPEPVRVNDELSLVPSAVVRMGTAPVPAIPPGNNLAGVTAVSAVLPDVVEINTRRDAGSQLISGLQTAAISELTIDAARLIPAVMESLALNQDPTAADPFDNLNDGTTFFTTVAVPATAVRLVAEVVETTAADIQLFVGRGLSPDAASVVCAGGAAAYCNIPSPDEGDWWILVQNQAVTAVQPDSLTLAYGVVPQYDSLCDLLADCLAEFQACLAAGGSFDECWQELIDCLLEGMDPATLARLKACLLDGWDDDCFEEWQECFPYWPDGAATLDMAATLNESYDDDGDCDGGNQYENNHEDDHFTHRKRCLGEYPWPKINLWVEGPFAVPEMEPYDLRVFWDEPDIDAGEIWYGAFDIGSEPSHPGDIGTMYVDLNRYDDDVTKQVSAETAVPGDILTYTISIQPNVTLEEPVYVITDTIPAGMTYVPGSAVATGGTVTVTGSVLTWSGPASVPGFTYHVDTSAANPACSAPSAVSDGVVDSYLNLAAFGISPDPIIFGNSVWYQSTFTGGEFYLFGSAQGNILNFTDDGFAFLSGSGPGAMPQSHQPIPTAADPNNLLAMLWRDMEIVYDGTRGVTLATLFSASQGREVGVIIEYDGVLDRTVPGSTATYDFEIIAYYGVDPDRYEYVFAYNNLTGPVTTGTIGLENALGTEGVQYGFNNLALSNGMAICFDQVGDGGTAVSISYQVRVDDNAFGVLTNEAVHNTDNPGSKEAAASADVQVTGANLFLSASSSGMAGSVDYADEDIVRYNLDTKEWAPFFDGSDVGLKGTDVDALHVQDDGSILLSLTHQLRIPGLGRVDDSDIIRFIPETVGENTSGYFEMFFDGSDFDLNSSGEDIDAFGFAPDGRLVVSLVSSFKVPETNSFSLAFRCGAGLDSAMQQDWFRRHCRGYLTGRDEDLIVLNEASGDWEMYFDGSDVLNRDQDVGGTWINPNTGDIYLSLENKFTIGGLSGDRLDVLICHPDALGKDTACTFAPELFFDGSEAGFSGYRIDGLAVGH